MMAPYELQPTARSWPVSGWPVAAEVGPWERLIITCCGAALGRATRCRSSVSRLATGLRACRFSHSLSSLRNEPSPQTILLQRSPSASKPCWQTSGQTRDDFSLMVSSASRLASLTSSRVPACRLNSAIERCDAVFHSPSAAPVRQPTRRSSACTDFATSAGDGFATSAGEGPGFSEATLVFLSP